MKPHVLAARLDTAAGLFRMEPALRALAAGAGRLTVLVAPEAAAAARGLSMVDAVRAWDPVWLERAAEPECDRQTLSFVHWLEEQRIDRAVIFTAPHQSPLPLALLLRLAGIREVAAISDEEPGTLLSQRVEVPEGLDDAARSLALVRAAGFTTRVGEAA